MRKLYGLMVKSVEYVNRFMFLTEEERNENANKVINAMSNKYVITIDALKEKCVLNGYYIVSIEYTDAVFTNKALEEIGLVEYVEGEDSEEDEERYHLSLPF